MTLDRESKYSPAAAAFDTNNLCPLNSAMSVLLETSAGDIVIDLLVDYAPKLCEK